MKAVYWEREGCMEGRGSMTGGGQLGLTWPWDHIKTSWNILCMTRGVIRRIYSSKSQGERSV